MALEQEDSFFVSDTEIAFAVAIDIRCHELGARSGIGVEKMWDEMRTLIAPNKLIPIEYRCALRVRVFAIVSPVTFSSGEVSQSIAIEITCY